jgi:hypothetical protein
LKGPVAWPLVWVIVGLLVDDGTNSTPLSNWIDQYYAD